MYTAIGTPKERYFIQLRCSPVGLSLRNFLPSTEKDGEAWCVEGAFGHNPHADRFRDAPAWIAAGPSALDPNADNPLLTGRRSRAQAKVVTLGQSEVGGWLPFAEVPEVRPPRTASERRFVPRRQLAFV